MLTLHRSSRTIVTDESFSVKLKWVNPCCFMDSIPGDVGLGLELSNNEYTRAEFGNPDRFEKLSSGQDRKFADMSIRFGGFLLQRGTMNITNATKETISAWLQSELGVLGTAQRDRFIPEMDWKTNVAFENKSEYNLTDDEYACIQIINSNFWEGHGRQVAEGATYYNKNGAISKTTEAINAQTLDFREFKDYFVNRLIITNWLSDVDGKSCVVSPFLYLNYVLKEVFRKNGFFVDQTNNLLNDPDFQLLVYNNFNIRKPVFELEDKVIPTWNVHINGYDYPTVATVVNTTWETGTFSYSDLIPKVALKDFILAIQNYLNIALHFKADKTVKIIDRNLIPDAQAYSLDAYFLGFWSIGDRKNVKLKFTQELDKEDELVSSDWTDLSDRKIDFNDSVEDWDQLIAQDPVFGELRVVRNQNKIYEFKWKVFASEDEKHNEQQVDACEWTFVSNMPQPFLFGDSDEIEEIKTGCSTLNNSRTHTIRQEIVKETKQPGNISTERSLWSDFSFRLLPYGNASLTDTLNFDGANGLFNRRWKRWATFWKNRLPIEGEFMLPINELYYVINNITQPFSTRHGKFIIEEMECDFQGEQMSTVKIKGYKL